MRTKTQFDELIPRVPDPSNIDDLRRYLNALNNTLEVLFKSVKADLDVIEAGATPHNELSGLQLAGNGVTYGHIDDNTQVIKGSKNFDTINAGGISTDALTINDDFNVSGNLTVVDLTVTGDVNVDHDDLDGIHQAGTGVTNGHISDTTQTIAGNKSFSGTVGVTGKLTSTDPSGIDHDLLTGIHAAGAGVTNGHISDGAQTIAGDKTLSGELNLKDMTSGTPTYTSLDDWFNTTRSSGRISGGTISAGTGTGTAKVSAMKAMIFSSNSISGQVKFIDVPEVDNIALTDLSVSWIYYDYTSATYASTVTRSAIHDFDQFPVGRVWRSGSTVEVLTTGHNIYNKDRRSHDRLILKYGVMDRVSGGVISQHATALRIQSSAGSWYAANTSYTTTAKDAVEVWYRSGSSAWNKSSALTLFSAVFDGGSNKLYESYQNGNSIGTLTANHYGTYWIFICPFGDLYVVMGESSYANIALAQAAAVPSSLPPYCVNWARLAGRVICKKTASALYSVESAFSTSFALSSAVDHNSLSNLDIAASGVTYGHINDTAQTVAGDKTFSGVVGASRIVETTKYGVSTDYFYVDRVNVPAILSFARLCFVGTGYGLALGGIRNSLYVHPDPGVDSTIILSDNTLSLLVYISMNRTTGVLSLTGTGAGTTITDPLTLSNLTASQAIMTDSAKKLVSVDYLDQAVKQASSPQFEKTSVNHIGEKTASHTIIADNDVTLSTLTASQAVMTDANKKLVSADYLDQAVKQASSPQFEKVSMNHLGEKTGSHGIVADNNILLTAGIKLMFSAT